VQELPGGGETVCTIDVTVQRAKCSDALVQGRQRIIHDERNVGHGNPADREDLILVCRVPACGSPTRGPVSRVRSKIRI
jgi:hypothetical protein